MIDCFEKCDVCRENLHVITTEEGELLCENCYVDYLEDSSEEHNEYYDYEDEDLYGLL